MQMGGGFNFLGGWDFAIECFGGHDRGGLSVLRTEKLSVWADSKGDGDFAGREFIFFAGSVIE